MNKRQLDDPTKEDAPVVALSLRMEDDLEDPESYVHHSEERLASARRHRKLAE